MGMAADVAEDRATADLLRAEVPVGRRVVELAANERGVVALHVLDVDHADLAEVAVADHGARLADQREAGVVEGLAEDEAGGLDALPRSSASSRLVGERLVADDVEAVLERRTRQGRNGCRSAS